MSAGKTIVRQIEPKKVPELALGDGQQAKVYVPAGLTPDQWLKIREKTVLAGQLFKENQYFLALNIVNELPFQFLLYDHQLILIGVWCYLNLGFYSKAEIYCEKILKLKDISGLRRALLMSLHMQGKYEDALSYTTILTPEEITEMSKLIQEIHVTFKNKVYPPYICAIGGHVTKLEEFLLHGGNRNEIYQAPRLGPGTPSLLYLAAANGQDEVVRLLLNLKYDSNATTTNTTTTTTTTTNTPTTNNTNTKTDDDKTDIKAVDKSIKKTTSSSTSTTPTTSPSQQLPVADIEFENVGWKSIHIASYLGYTNVVSTLIKGGANIHSKMYGSGSNPLQLALIGNNITTARLLMAAKANIHDNMPVTPNLGVVENFILVPGTTAIKVDALQGPAYWHVAAKGRVELLQQLIQDNLISVNIQNKLNRHATLLHFATGRGITGERCDYNMVKMLLDLKANPNILTENGYSPLHYACRCGDSATLPTVRLLLDAKVDLNTITAYNETPLICALSADNVPTVRELLERGCNVKQSEEQLKQPLLVWTVLQSTNYLVKAVLEGYWTKLSYELGLPPEIQGTATTITPNTTTYDPEKNSINESTTSTTTTTTTSTTNTPPSTTPTTNQQQQQQQQQSKQPIKKYDESKLDPQKVAQRGRLMSEFVNTKSNKVGLSALHWSCFKGDWVNVGLLLRFGANPELKCQYESVTVTPLKCCMMYNVGKQFGTEKEDMDDCATIIKQCIAILNGSAPERPVIHDIQIHNDIHDNTTQKDVDMLLSKRQQEANQLQKQTQLDNEAINRQVENGIDDDDNNVEYDEDDEWYDGEGEDEGDIGFWDGDGEEWLEQYEYDDNTTNNDGKK